METLNLNIWAIFYAAMAVQGFIISVVLFTTSKGNPQANKILAIIILSFSCTRMQSFLSIAGLVQAFPHTIFLATPFWYVLAPLYFLYIKSLYDPSQKMHWKDLFHLLPFAAVIIYLLPFYIVPGEIKIQFWTQTFNAGFGLSRYLFALLYDLQNIIYLAFILIYSRKYKSNGANVFEQPQKPYIKWLKFLYVFITVYILLDLLITSLNYITGIRYLEMQFLPMVIFSILIYSVSFLALKDPQSLFPHYLLNRKTASSSADDQKLQQQLITIMEEQQLFRNNNLRYSDIATLLGVSVSQVSKLFNNGLGKNFNDFVNGYRVKDAQKRLNSDEADKYTLLSLAFNAGFNSKASFNRIFKRHTGITPSEYIKNQKERAS